MDERARKLLIAGVAVALFVGFIFFTRWSGDDPGSVESLGDQELSDLEQFCFAINAGFMDYDTMLGAVAGFSADGSGLPLDSNTARNLAENLLTNLVDSLPDDYSDQGALAVEGLERAIDGDLDEGEVDRYVSAFEELQEESADDCEAVGTSGIGGEGPFG